MAPIRVMVADDDPVVRAMLRSALEAADDMELAGEAKTAVDTVGLARETQPDVVVLDHHMPAGLYQRTAIHGIEALEYLKALPSPPRIVVYSSTGTLVDAATRAGADAFVEKTGDCSALLDAVRSVVPRR